MKSLTLLFAFSTLALINTISAQNIYTYVEQMPESSVNVSEYLSTQLVYPQSAQEQNIEGKVVLKFVVDSLGNLRDITVIRSVHPALDSESIRVVSSMPDWKPGKQNGKAVNVYYTLPINFKLQESIEEVATTDTVRLVFPKPTFNILAYYKENIIYPEHLMKRKVEGSVVAEYTIDTFGRVINSSFQTDSDIAFKEEVKKLVTLMPLWKSGTLNGKSVCYTLKQKFYFFIATSEGHRSSVRASSANKFYLKQYKFSEVQLVKYEENCSPNPN